MDETAKQFRYIDAREKTLPVSISATPRGWVNAFTATLPSEQKTEFDRSGLTILLEQIIENQGRLAGWGRENRMDYPPEIFKKAIHHLAHPEWYSAALLAQSEGQEKARLEHDLKKYAPQSSVVTRSLLDSFWESMNSWEAGLGISIWHESEFRPTVVLFDRENQLSQVVAAVIHECFYGRYVMQRAIRPVLYISDLADKTLPGILEFASNTAIANGIEDKDSEVWNDITMSRALFCTSVESGLVFSGQRHDC